jgi:hypothetical protein
MFVIMFRLCIIFFLDQRAHGTAYIESTKVYAGRVSPQAITGAQRNKEKTCKGLPFPPSPRVRFCTLTEKRTATL